VRHGFLLVDKPVGPTSHDVVATVRRTLSERAVGHLGTLDPAASGLMVLAVGAKALKAVELFMGLPKEYEADVTLGAVSTTYDRDGHIEPFLLKPGVERPEVEIVLRAIRERFVGKIRQRPPAHSAVHIDGERAYDRARRGEAVEMPEREVTIEACDIVSYAYPDLKLRVRCGSGTYIRSLANDLGAVLRTGGYLAGLRRTRLGDWTVDGALAPADVRWTAVMPLKEVMKALPGIDLTDAQAAEIRLGRDIPVAIERPNTVAWHGELPVALLVAAGEGTAHPRKVF
jgi:tRNA pseudouridine55 synthase